jgi:hypothetical protein
MTNGFMPQQNNGAQYPQQQQYAPPPAQQAPQFGAPQQTGGYFEQPQAGTAAPPWQPAQQHVPQYQQGMGVAPGNFAPAQPETIDDTEGFFGGGAAYVSWNSETGYRDGTPRGGLIVSKRMANQTDMDTGEVVMSKYQKGQPVQQLVLTLQTGERVDPDDDGQRQMVVKSGLRKAAKQAFEAVGAKDLEIGGWFYAARIRKEPIPNSKYKRNVFSAIYARPGSPDPMAGQPVYPAPAPPPAAPQQPAQFNPMAAQQNFGASGFAPQPQQQGQYAPQLAQYDAAMNQGAPGGFAPQQPTQGQPGPIANMPQQYAARIDGMYQQALQMDPQLAAQAQTPEGFANQPGAPMNGAAQPPTQQPNPQGQPGQWTPFSQ